MLPAGGKPESAGTFRQPTAGGCRKRPGKTEVGSEEVKE